MSVAGWVVRGDEEVLEQRAGSRAEPCPGDTGDPFGNVIPRPRHPLETNAFPNSPAWLTSWRIPVRQDSLIESSFFACLLGTQACQFETLSQACSHPCWISNPNVPKLAAFEETATIRVGGDLTEVGRVRV